MTKDELLKKEVEEYLSTQPTDGARDFVVYKIPAGENAFFYVVEHKNELRSSDWVKMYEGTELECYRAVGYLDSATDYSERIEKLEQKLEKETAQRIYNFNKAIEWKEKYRALKKEARAIMNIGVEAVKRYSVVGGYERPFLKEAEMMFNLFFDKADQFLSEDKDENTSHQEGSIE